MNAPIQNDDSPFHRGEQEMQRRNGKRDRMERIGRAVIRPFMPDQHREFFSKLPFLVVGSVDGDGWPWASMLAGRPGFITSPNAKRMDVRTRVLVADPLAASLKLAAAIGTVGVELTTRRRNRMNAKVSGLSDGNISLDVIQSFGNCPQYIQTQDIRFVRDPDEVDICTSHHRFTSFSQEAKAMIQSASSFYVASHSPIAEHPSGRGVDVSHRGGQPGFVKVDGNTLTIPDFAGNNFFNTLGNILVTPRTGLLFPDYQTGNLLMVTGTAEVLTPDHPDLAGFRGAERGWRFSLDHGVMINDALPFRAALLEISPNSLQTDNWPKAMARKRRQATQNSWQSLRVASIFDESTVIRSFVLQPTDDDPLPTFEAGQFLTLRIAQGDGQYVTRTYTVSSAPDDAGYRISVKREHGGLISTYLHDHIKVGDQIDVQTPRGSFFLDPNQTRPAVLIAGGVGITPMVSMVRHVLNEGLRTGHTRLLTVFHAAQSSKQRAFSHELRTAAQRSPGAIRYITALDTPETGTHRGVDYNVQGFITADLIRDTLALADYDFYLCGPGPFMQSIYDTLCSLGVQDRRIFAESFGPAALSRTPNTDPNAAAQPEAKAAEVAFHKSGLKAQWSPDRGSLLEMAEDLGLSPEFSCRTGICGTCSTRKLAGQVTYRTPPTAKHNENEVLLCCAVPAASGARLVLDL